MDRKNIQSNLNGSNTLGTMKICLRRVVPPRVSFYKKRPLGTQEKFLSGRVDEPSGFEPLKFYCIFMKNCQN